MRLVLHPSEVSVRLLLHLSEVSVRIVLHLPELLPVPVRRARHSAHVLELAAGDGEGLHVGDARGRHRPALLPRRVQPLHHHGLTTRLKQKNIVNDKSAVDNLKLELNLTVPTNTLIF